MRTQFRTVKRVLILVLVLVLSGWRISGKSVVQKNQMGINESYIGCLMFDNDPNSIQKCSDLRWGSEQALYNNTKAPSNVTLKDLKKATPPNTDQK